MRLPIPNWLAAYARSSMTWFWRARSASPPPTRAECERILGEMWQRAQKEW